MEACLGEELPPPTELEETLRNGVLLAKLGHCFAPATVPLKKIYDREQTRYRVRLGVGWGGTFLGEPLVRAGTFPWAAERGMGRCHRRRQFNRARLQVGSRLPWGGHSLCLCL